MRLAQTFKVCEPGNGSWKRTREGVRQPDKAATPEFLPRFPSPWLGSGQGCEAPRGSTAQRTLLRPPGDAVVKTEGASNCGDLLRPSRPGDLSIDPGI